MKNKVILLTSLFMLNIFYSAIGQTEDQQWLIRDGVGKEGVQQGNNYLNSFTRNLSNVSGYKIEGIASVGPQDLANGKIKANRYFTIFADGTYSIISDNRGNPEFTNPTPPRNILYQYLTNIYEGDDVKGNVRLVTQNSGLNSIPASTGYFNNQDITSVSDITLILNAGTLSNVPTAQLCYTVSNGQNVTFDPSGFKQLDSKNLLSFDANSITLSNAIFGANGMPSNCIALNQTTKNLFLNFRPRYNDDAVGAQVVFTINAGDRPKEMQPINISGQFHDPNFVALKCVWVEGNKKFARYKVSCFNDGGTPVDNLNMSLTLPAACDMSSIKISNWMVGKKSCCGEGKKFHFTTLGQTLKVEFMPDIIPYQNGSLLLALEDPNDILDENKAWFEFCVELDPSTNIYTDDLQPSNPYTTFGAHYTTPDVDYPIDTYLDEKICLDNALLGSYTNGSVATSEHKCTIVRKNTEKCGKCGCCFLSFLKFW